MMHTKRPTFRLDEEGFEPIYCALCYELLYITSDAPGQEYYKCPTHGRIETYEFSRMLQKEDMN